MPLRALFFDLDDTLLDTAGNRERAERWVKILGQEHPWLERNRFVENLLTNHEADQPLDFGKIIDDFGLSESAVRESIRLRNDADADADAEAEVVVRTIPGAAEMLITLGRDFKLGVITNGKEGRQRGKFQTLPCHDLFDVFLTSERAGAEKPDATIFGLALREAGVGPAESVFVGDDPYVDVEGSKRAGMKAIWFERSGEASPAPASSPDAIISDLGELPGVLPLLTSR